MRVNFCISFILAFFSLDAYALVGGKTIEGFPDLVRIVFKNDTMCSGVFIDESTLLTSAHCITKEAVGGEPEVKEILSSLDLPLPLSILEAHAHPLYNHDAWPSYDIGILKTSKNLNFHRDFKLGERPPAFYGKIEIYACGLSEFKPKKRTRSKGDNTALKLGAVLIFEGRTRNSANQTEGRATIAPNDSGGPVVDLSSGLLIAIASKTTIDQSDEYSLPAISLATSLENDSTRAFIERYRNAAATKI